MSMMVQMPLTNHLPCMLVIIGQMPWDPSATHFPIPEVMMDNIVRRAVTRVEFYSNFINSDFACSHGFDAVSLSQLPR
jgi:hypothetical protein